MFKRKIYDKLLAWKQESAGKNSTIDRRSPSNWENLLLWKNLRKNEYDSYILIDFSTASKNVRELFEDVSDLNYLFLQLQFQYRTDLIERKSLIIFDEVQLCPLARQAI